MVGAGAVQAVQAGVGAGTSVSELEAQVTELQADKAELETLIAELQAEKVALQAHVAELQQADVIIKVSVGKCGIV